MTFQYFSHTRACISFHLCYTIGRLNIDLNLINKSRNRIFLLSFLELLFFKLLIIYTSQLKSSNQGVFISDWEISYKMIFFFYTAILFNSVS